MKTQTCEVVGSAGQKTIWKFPLIIQDRQLCRMPAGAEVLCVQLQHGCPYLWAVVNKTARLVDRYFLIRGTGHDAFGVGRYVGTFHMAGGDLVFHVFEAA